MALKGRDKLLITIPQDFDPEFDRNLDRRTRIAQWLTGKKMALLAHCGGVENVDTVKLEKIDSLAWLELIRKTYEYRFLQGEQIDLGGLTHIRTAISGLEKDLRKADTSDASGAEALQRYLAKHRKASAGATQ
jgi:hypothetical protein